MGTTDFIPCSFPPKECENKLNFNMKGLTAHQAEFQESRAGVGGQRFAQYWEINFNLSGIEMFLGINNVIAQCFLSMATKD